MEKLKAASSAGAPFELILLDVMMPGIDGREVARRVHQQVGEAAPPKILVFSSAGSPVTPAEAAELGITRVLTKPIKPRDLLDAITQVFGKTIAGEDNAPPSAAARPDGIHAMRVLLAEDGRVNQLVASRMLAARGHTVVVAEDGQAAVEEHARGSYDAILMDVQMPRLDGFGATRVIREREQESGDHIRIIAMTANAMKGDREKCLASGMDDYIAKPVRSEELFSALEDDAKATRNEPPEKKPE